TDELTFSTAGFRCCPWFLYRAEEEFHLDCINETWKSKRLGVKKENRDDIL
ncbi:hypothetical protein L873DRAFT_1666095, partial [Choiromyces venosus 120613-1]